VELLDRALGHTAVVVVDECKATRAARVAICRNDDLHGIADRAEVLPDIRFGCDVREIADE
jgi:hypothetical protein